VKWKVQARGPLVERQHQAVRRRFGAEPDDGIGLTAKSGSFGGTEAERLPVMRAAQIRCTERSESRHPRCSEVRCRYHSEIVEDTTSPQFKVSGHPFGAVPGEASRRAHEIPRRLRGTAFRESRPLFEGHILLTGSVRGTWRLGSRSFFEGGPCAVPDESASACNGLWSFVKAGLQLWTVIVAIPHICLLMVDKACALQNRQLLSRLCGLG
jgi:hypothetical protein